MIASGIRTYMNDRVGECFPDFEEWTDYFNINNIPSQVIDCRYHIEIGVTSSDTTDLVVEDTTSVIVRFFKKAQNSECMQEDFDGMYDCAHAFKMNAQDPSKYAENTTIKRVLSTGITPQEQNVSNDNLIQLDVEFTVIGYFNC